MRRVPSSTRCLRAKSPRSTGSRLKVRLRMLRLNKGENDGLHREMVWPFTGRRRRISGGIVVGGDRARGGGHLLSPAHRRASVGAAGRTALIAGGLKTRNCRWIAVPGAADPRGRVNFLELGKSLDFQPKRLFWLHHVAAGQWRGRHGHRETKLVLVE